MLKIGVIGAGHLGKIHIQQWKEVPTVQLIGFFDPSDEQAEKAIAEYNVIRYTDIDALIQEADALDIVAPTTNHYDIAKKCLLAGKHFFIEKPLANTLEEGRELVKLVKEAGVKCQVGHVERYNPAYLALTEETLQPMFIEAHRLSQFNPRGTDVSVILDLMIHDIDIVMHLVKSPVRRISASGVSVISETPDIANARIEFENGCVANLTASRISMKNMRKSRFFQKDAYISVDFLEKRCEVVKMKDAPEVPGDFDMILQNAEGVKKQIYFSNPEVEQNNAILDELNSFEDAINNNTTPVVTLEQATEALRVAYQIIDCFKK